MLGLELENAKNWFWPILRVILGHKSVKKFFSKYTMFFTGVVYPISDIELCMVFRFILHRFNAALIMLHIIDLFSLPYIMSSGPRKMAVHIYAHIPGCMYVALTFSFYIISLNTYFYRISYASP